MVLVPFWAPWEDPVLGFRARALPSVPIGLGDTTVVLGAIEETSLWESNGFFSLVSMEAVGELVSPWLLKPDTGPARNKRGEDPNQAPRLLGPPTSTRDLRAATITCCP